MKIVEKTTHFDLHVVVVSNDTLLPMKVIVCVEQYIFLQFHDLKAILFKIQMTCKQVVIYKCLGKSYPPSYHNIYS